MIATLTGQGRGMGFWREPVQSITLSMTSGVANNRIALVTEPEHAGSVRPQEGPRKPC